MDELKQHLHTANNRTKQLADRKRRDVEFQEGDWVFLRLQPYRQKTILKRSSRKWSHRFFGPFKIDKRIGQVAYYRKGPVSILCSMYPYLKNDWVMMSQHGLSCCQCEGMSCFSWNQRTCSPQDEFAGVQNPYVRCSCSGWVCRWKRRRGKIIISLWLVFQPFT